MRPVRRSVGLILLAIGGCVAVLASGCSRGTLPATGAYGVTSRPAAVADEPKDGFYVVGRGDTVYGIARRHDTGVRAIIEVNALKPPYRLVVGQRLRLPTLREHMVEAGDTVYGISRRYGVDMAALVRANGVKPPYTIKVGQRLRLPGATEPVRQTSASTIVALKAGKSDPSPSSATPSKTKSARPTRSDGLAQAVPPPRSGKRFLWPVKGKVISGFGPKGKGLHNDGVNIAAPQGTPVVAAENGLVVYAGNELRGFGNLLLIRHADGWVTAYAHNRSLLVRRGERVKRGQVIARIGKSGSVGTPQLHFEVRRGSSAVDPIGYLTTAARAPQASNSVAYRDGRPGPG